MVLVRLKIEFSKELFNNNFTALENLSDALKQNYILMDTIIKIDGLAIKYVSPIIIDYDLALAAVKQNGMALGWLTCMGGVHTANRLIQEFKLTPKELAAINDKKANYCDKYSELSENFEICMAAVEQNGLALHYVNILNGSFDKDYCNYYVELAIAAVKQNPNALENLYDIIFQEDFLFEDRLNTYTDIALAALAKDCEAIAYVDVAIKKNHPDVYKELFIQAINQAVANDPELIDVELSDTE